MNKEILVETIKSKFEVLKDKPANVLKRIKMVLSDWDFNRNGRVYPKELWENVIDSDYVKEMINSHGLVGELDHPEDRLEISLQNVSHVINDMWIDGDKLMGVIDILPTPNGKIVNELLDYGTEIGISSRGAGSVGADNTVDPDYQFVTFDFVARPSCEAARYKAILEGVKLDIDNNSDAKVKNILEGYKTSLKEDIFKNYYNKPALPTPGEEELYGYDLSEVCDNVEKYFGLKNKREALNKIVEEHLDKKVIDEVMKHSNLKEDNTTSSYIDIREIVRYAEEYLAALLNSSVGITRQQDGQYMITMRNDDKTISKWLDLHDRHNLNEESDFETYTDYSGERPVEKKRHTMSYCNMAALDMCKDALSDQLGVNWRKKSLSDIEDIVHNTVFRYNEANVQPDYEDEEFYGDEANAREVYQYILDNEIPKENKTTETKVNESTYIIKQIAGSFGTYTVCEWEADSPEQAVSEFLEANPKYKDGKYGKITAVLKENDSLFEATMSDQEVYKIVLNWYKEQIEAGKMTLNQCYELLSDKAKVSLNKIVDQSKIKESIMNNTIKKLINESIELNNQETLSKEQYRDKVLETIDKMVKISELYEKLTMIENSVKLKNHEKWRSIPLRSNMTGHYRYWVSDSLTRDESKYFKKEKYNDGLNQGEAYVEKNNNILTRKMNNCYLSLDKFIKNADKFLDNLLKAGVDEKIYKSIKKILEYKDYVYDDEDMKIQIENIYKIDRLLKKSL